MASATMSGVSVSPLQSRQMSGALSSSSGTHFGDNNTFLAQSSSSANRASHRGSSTVVMSQQHQHTNFGSKVETFSPCRWVHDPVLRPVDAVSSANAVRAVTSPALPLSTWDESAATASQGVGCGWPESQTVSEGPSVLFLKEDQEVEEGQQLHEEFAGELIKRSKSEQLLFESKETPLGPRSAWPRRGVITESEEQLLGPRSAWPRVAASPVSVEPVVGPRCAWPRLETVAPLSLEPEESVLAPRCEFPRRAVVKSVIAPLQMAGAACAWPRQSQCAVSVVPELEPLYPRCEWPRKEVAVNMVVGPVTGLSSAKRALKSEGAKGARVSKVKREPQRWPWGVVSVGLEPVPDVGLAKGPRCAWPRVQLEDAVGKPLMHEASRPVQAGPRCAWPSAASAATLAAASHTLGPRCALKVAAPAPVLASGAACEWPRASSVQAVSKEEPRPLGPRCALKLPEETPMGPRCALKSPLEPVLGPRCALKSPVVEEVKIEGPRCAWPKPGSEPILPQPVAEKEDVTPEKVQRKRPGVLPRRGLFTRIPVKYVKGPTLARVGKVKVAQPQAEGENGGRGAAQPVEKMVGGATWPRRLLASSLGLGALNEVLVRSQAQAGVIESPAVMGWRLESLRTGVQSARQNTSS